jgi:TaqI-like C-terminal specificity domain
MRGAKSARGSFSPMTCGRSIPAAGLTSMHAGKNWSNATSQAAPRLKDNGTSMGRSQSLTSFDTPKIILPVLSTEPRYSYDDANTFFTGGGNGPYYMVRPRNGAAVSNHYLLAVLNHPLSEALIRTNTSPFRGGYYSHGKQFIQTLPVPMPSEADRAVIEQLVATLIGNMDALAAARTPHQRTVHERAAADLRAEIETHVSALFALSAADIDVVRAVPVPT